MSNRATLANTIRALELLADSHTAYQTGDNDTCNTSATASPQCPKTRTDPWP